MNIATQSSPAAHRRLALFIPRKWALNLALALILAVALGLRLYGINWDQGSLFHPDERAILMNVEKLSPPPANDLGLLLDADESPWNPRWFNYGSLPLYLLKGVQLIYEPIDKWNIYDLRIPGRAISALADALTVLMVFLLGSRLYGRRTGLLASALIALAVIHIQLSHFFAVDTLLTLFAVLSMFFIIKVAQRGRLRDSALAGLFLGMGLATKFSLTPLILIFLLAHAMYALSQEDEHLKLALPSKRRLARGLGGLALGAVVSFAVFFITEPYALLEWPVLKITGEGFGGLVQGIKGLLASTGEGFKGNTFINDMARESAMVRRVVDFPYTRQYIDTTPYLYHIQQLAVWGLGLPLGIVAWLGLIAGAFYSLLQRRKGDILILSWVLLYFLIVGSFQVKFMRYLLPITPFLVLMGSRMLLDAASWLTQRRPRLTPWLVGGLALLIGATAFYAVSYVTIYSRPHTAVRASEWIRANVPKDTVILKEHWEEGLPNLAGYQIRELPMYEPDTPDKIKTLAQELSRAEYMAFYSNRLYGTISRLQERYPQSAKYYQMLFSGELGYELAHFETSYPGLWGVTFVDDTFTRPGFSPPAPLDSFEPSSLPLNMGYADESFTVYDHPKVLIFRNVKHLSTQRLQALLEQPPVGLESGLGLVFSPTDATLQQSGGTWSQIVARDSWPNRLPVLAWLILVEGMAVLVLPITLLVFRPLPDRGYLFSKVLGLLLTSYLVWLLASLRWMPFSRTSILVALVLLWAVSLAIMAFRREELKAFVKERWRLLVIGEALFLAAFFAFLMVRLANPDLWHPFRGGEKPMDFAYLNAVLKSTIMPPYDPWFAGGYLNYYYMGQFMVATVIKATGIVPAVAFNLAVPTFFAMVVGGAFALVYNLAEGTRRSLGGKGFSWSPVLAGVAGGIFVVVLGNLDGAVQVGQGAWRALVESRPFGVFDYWRSSRMMPPDPPGFEITEFPFFTFLFADLHAHLMALPITILTLGLGAALVIGRVVKAGMDKAARWEEALQLVVLSLALGSLLAINAWDFPTYMIVAAVAISLKEYLTHGGLGLMVVVRAAVKIGIVFGIAYLLFLPFHLNNQTFYNGLEPTTNRTALWQFMGIHGFFIFIIVTFLLYQSLRWLSPLIRGLRRSPIPSLEGFPSYPGEGSAPTSKLSLGRLAVLALVLAALAYGVVALIKALAHLAGPPTPPPGLLPYDTIILLGALIVLVAVLAKEWLTRWRPVSPYTAFAAVLLGVALALALGVDVFRIKNDIDRMNTVFKFYLQIWVMLALVSAYFLWYLGRARPGLFRRLRPGKCVWLGVLAVLLVSASIYTVMGAQVRLRDRFRVLPLTLNGMAYMKEATYSDPKGPIDLSWDYQAIRWLQDNVEGSPVILEGVTPTYRWGSRVSVYTGLPTVVGWEWHQIQQRGANGWAVNRRIADVNRMYSTTSVDEALGLLKRYGVKYIYVGEVERLYYPESGLAKFRDMAGRYLERVYETQRVAIYRLK